MTTTRPRLTVKAAVESCQVSEKTIRRHLPALQEHGAYRDDDGQWRIPIEALQEIGLRPGKPKGPDRRDRDQDDQVVNDQLTTVADQLKAQADQADRAELRAERDRYRDLYESERRHVETLMGNVADLRRQLTPATSAEPLTSPEQPAPARDRWFRRTFGRRPTRP